MFPPWYSPAYSSLRSGGSIARIEGPHHGYRFRGCVHGVPWFHGGEVDSALGELRSLVGEAELLPLLTVESQRPGGRRWPSPPGNLYASFFLPFPAEDAEIRVSRSLESLLAGFTNHARVRTVRAGEGVLLHRLLYLGGFKVESVAGGAIVGVDIHVAADRAPYAAVGDDGLHAFLEDFTRAGEDDARELSPFDVFCAWAPYLEEVLQVRAVWPPRRGGSPLALWEAAEFGTYVAVLPFRQCWSSFRLPVVDEWAMVDRLERWGAAIGLSPDVIRADVDAMQAAPHEGRDELDVRDLRIRRTWGVAALSSLSERGQACFVLASSLAQIQAVLLHILLPATLSGPVDWPRVRDELAPHLQVVMSCVAALGPPVVTARRAASLVVARLGEPAGAVWVAVAGELLELAIEIVIHWAAAAEGVRLEGRGFGRARVLADTPAEAFDVLVASVQRQRWFISYSTNDAIHADLVQAALLGAGAVVFLDNSSLPVHSVLRDHLRAEVEASTHFVLLWGADTPSRPWVEEEWRGAVSGGARHVGVLLVPGGDPSSLPPELAERSFADARTDISGALARLALTMSESPFRRFAASRRVGGTHTGRGFSSE